MKFRKFRQNKLWRDKAVERMERMGSKIHWERLGDHEFSAQLKEKIMEEAHEVAQVRTTEQLCEELADVLEVMNSLCAVHGLTLKEVMAAQKKKHDERGGFEGRKFVTIAEHPVGGFGEKYCLADPEKYPEILD
jgi:predicted house-cleaning noncanonical NTP pyrophosphatase (MazG superfamily)